MVDTLNTILLTSSELFQFRNQLKRSESGALFRCLYETWCHNPVATIALGLLTQNYEHVCKIIEALANYEVTVQFLAEIDRLIQLIESPIFIYLRLQLLETPENYYLIRAMYGLLMLLPQSDAFHMLRRRLDCIPKLHLLYNSRSIVKNDVTHIKGTGNMFEDIDFNLLIEKFYEVQINHATGNKSPLKK